MIIKKTCNLVGYINQPKVLGLVLVSMVGAAAVATGGGHSGVWLHTGIHEFLCRGGGGGMDMGNS